MSREDMAFFIRYQALGVRYQMPGVACPRHSIIWNVWDSLAGMNAHVK